MRHSPGMRSYSRRSCCRLLYWLVSPDSDGLTDQHFLAAKWDSALASSIAVERAAAPIGWRDIAVLPITPQIQKGTRMNLRKRFLLVHSSTFLNLRRDGKYRN